MADEWRHSIVGNEVDILLGYAFKSAEFFTELPGTRLVRGDNVKRGFIEWGDKARFWRTTTPDLERYALREGDIVVGMDGSRVGENFARVSISDLPAFLVQRVACLRARSEMYQGFLRYVICNPNFTAYIKAVHTGTSIPHISGGQIAAYPVSVPPLREQQAIACILGALDDKIELNRRRNETLEGMARALFQSWFVDFDPVRAKSAGRTPHGLKPELAELFPDSFEVSAVGEIPKGWYEAKLGEVADVNWGDTSVTKSAYTDRGFTAYSAKGPDGLLPYFDFDRVGIVVSAIGANSGFTWLARGKWSCIKNTLRFWATDQDISTEYLFFATHGNNIWPLRGSAQPFIAQADARNLRVLYPLRSIARRFGELVDPFLSQSQANDCESRSLAALRDTLLPKLISGEMRVPDAERIVGRAT